jgi:hypothetical protein
MASFHATERNETMNLKHTALAGAAIVALAGFIGAAQAGTTAEENEITRQLNLEQLEKARSASPAPAPTTAVPSTTDGQGGPELKGPPRADEGMTDDTTDKTTDTPKEENAAPPTEEPAPEAKSPPSPY